MSIFSRMFRRGPRDPDDGPHEGVADGADSEADAGADAAAEAAAGARTRARAAAAAAAASTASAPGADGYGGHSGYGGYGGDGAMDADEDTDPGLDPAALAGMMMGAESAESPRVTERFERLGRGGRSDMLDLDDEATPLPAPRTTTPRSSLPAGAHDSTQVMKVSVADAADPARRTGRTPRSYALPPGVVDPGPVERDATQGNDREAESATSPAPPEAGNNGQARRRAGTGTLTGMARLTREPATPSAEAASAGIAAAPGSPDQMAAASPAASAPSVASPLGSGRLRMPALSRSTGPARTVPAPAGRGLKKVPPPPPQPALSPDAGWDAAPVAPVEVDAVDAAPPGPPPSVASAPVASSALVPAEAQPSSSSSASGSSASESAVAESEPSQSEPSPAPSPSDDSPPGPPPPPHRHIDRVTTAEDRAELRSLFTELAGHHMVQLRDFMIEVRCGSALAEWIALSEPAVRSVRGMAEQLELDDICEALELLLIALTSAQRSGGAIGSEHQAALLAAYEPLTDMLPGVLELDAERNRREPIIVHSLLRQIPGIEKVAIDKLVAASLVSVAALAEARPEELAQVTGLAPDLSERVVARFRDYRRQSGAVASADPRGELRMLGELLARLRQQNSDYDFAAGSWAPGIKERKRQLRRERAETLLAIHVSLARLGEVDRLVELDRLSFRRKVEFIENTLQAARAAARARTSPT